MLKAMHMPFCGHIKVTTKVEARMSRYELTSTCGLLVFFKFICCSTWHRLCFGTLRRSHLVLANQWNLREVAVDYHLDPTAARPHAPLWRSCARHGRHGGPLDGSGSSSAKLLNCPPTWTSWSSTLERCWRGWRWDRWRRWELYKLHWKIGTVCMPTCTVFPMKL